MKSISRHILLLVAAVCAAALLAAPGRAAQIKEPAWKKLDTKSLVALLSKGELISVEKVGGGIELSTIGMLVRATPDKVWNTIVDFKNVPNIVPSCTKAVMTPGKGNTATVAFNIRVIKLGPLDITADYTLKYVFKKPKRMDISWVKGTVKDVQGYWEIIPVNGGKQSVVVYAITSNLKEASSVAKMALQQQPSTETAINLSSAIVLTKAIKRKAESSK